MESSNTFRHNFTPIFTSLLYEFAKIHQHDNRKDYKEAWKLWLENNENSVSQETNRLKSNGYNGNIQDKMYKSARYYFRKKQDHGERKKETKIRKQYISLDHEFLTCMDDHIKRSERSCKPSLSFEMFCIMYENEINEEQARLIDEYNIDVEQYNKKIKKTYKNRHFLIMNEN